MSTPVEHTPLPWGAHGSTIQAGEAGGHCCVAKTNQLCDSGCPRENAAFIVRACNSYDALVDTLTTLLDAVETEPKMDIFKVIKTRARAALPATGDTPCTQ